MAFLDHDSFFVFGMARSGRAVSALLAERGYDVTVYDENQSATDGFVESIDYRNNECRIDVAGEGSWNDRLDRAGCLVVSPGVPLDHVLVERARERGIEVVGEIEAAFHFNTARLIGVTGTNGKSTVVGVIGEILAESGVDVVVAGNIGNPFADTVRGTQPDVVVLELSSFQLDTIDEFTVDVAVLLNVTPDHLDRYHNSFDEYVASKARILNRAGTDTLYVFNADDESAEFLGRSHRGPKMAFSSSRTLDKGLYLENGAIVRRLEGRPEEIIARTDFTPVGVHNLENAMAAVAAVTPFEVDIADMREALRAYRPLPHRMELVRIIGGVAFINDSKATNVDAAVKSLISIDGGTVIILGGRDKDGNFALLTPHLNNVRLVVLIGEAAGVIREALAGRCPLADAANMDDAVSQATTAVEPGETILLAPACASFDMYDNYQTRGEAFRAAVNSL